MIPVDELEGRVPEVPWKRVYGSGRRIEEPISTSLTRLWDEHFKTSPGAPSGHRVGDDKLGPDAEDVVGSLAAGFGPDSAKNRRVELAAMAAATDWYEAQGFEVDNISGRKCGWDLTLSGAVEVEWHVEVKGVSGSSPCVILTANEFAHASSDGAWVIAVVTSALADSQVTEYLGESVVRQATPFAFRVDLTDEDPVSS